MIKSSDRFILLETENKDDFFGISNRSESPLLFLREYTMVAEKNSYFEINTVTSVLNKHLLRWKLSKFWNISISKLL